MGLHKGDGSVKCHWAIQFVFEDITVVQSVWIRKVILIDSPVFRRKSMFDYWGV
jgi:hypothetical protein